MRHVGGRQASLLAAAVLAAAVLGAALAAGTASAVRTPDQRYVATWSRPYTTFARTYARMFLPCARRQRAKCAADQKLAAGAAAKAASILRSSAPPSGLRADIRRLERDLARAHRALAASAAASRAGRTNERVWCSGEQGPCTAPVNDMVNTIGDINDSAGVNLRLPA